MTKLEKRLRKESEPLPKGARYYVTTYSESETDLFDDPAEDCRRDLNYALRTVREVLDLPERTRIDTVASEMSSFLSPGYTLGVAAWRRSDGLVAVLFIGF